MQSKVCSTCGTEKCITEFFRDSRVRSGVKAQCKSCARARKAASKLSPVTRPRKTADQIRNRKCAGQEAYRRKHRAKSLVNRAKARAKKKGHAFDLAQYLPQLQARIDKGICEVTGIPLNLDEGLTYDSPSLDRIIPKLGYVYSNIRVVCYLVNTAMGNWGAKTLQDVMLTWINADRPDKV